MSGGDGTEVDAAEKARCMLQALAIINGHIGTDGGVFSGSLSRLQNAIAAAIYHARTWHAMDDPYHPAPQDRDVLLSAPDHLVMLGRWVRVKKDFEKTHWHSAWYGAPINVEPNYWCEIPRPPQDSRSATLNYAPLPAAKGG